MLIREENKKEVSYINPHLFSTGADVGQTARATTGDSSDRGAEQRQPAGGAVVMATVVWDHIDPERPRAASSGHSSTQNTHHRTPGGLHSLN